MGSEVTDEELLASYLEGDPGSFEELVRRHEDRIFALSLRMLADRHEALDATQETFVRAFRKADRFRGDSAFGTWLYRIGINTCKDALRKRSRVPVPQDTLEERDPGEPDIAEGIVLGAELTEALEQLNEDYRVAVLMHDLGGFPYEDIAATTEVSVGTVKSRISRGRRKLADLLEPQGPDESSKEMT